MKSGKLWILPNTIGDSDEKYLPSCLENIIPNLDGLIAESEKIGRRFISRYRKPQGFPVYMLNEHTKQVDDLIDLLLKGNHMGLISDAGVPCIADPGSDLVFLARRNKIEIEIIPGVSSIFLAIIASGLNGNRFCFHGYLPRSPDLLKKKLEQLEKRSSIEESTQIWIETPYRGEKMLDFCKKFLMSNTYLCIASAFYTQKEQVIVQSIQNWENSGQKILKEPAVFLLATKKN